MSNVSCGICTNVLAYADDLVLCAPSWHALQCLIDVLFSHATSLNMTCNVHKTVCMVFAPRMKSKVVLNSFPAFCVGGTQLKFVHEFKYLGHIISCSLSDDDDIAREVRNLFVRTNILFRRFCKCSIVVKRTLFKAYCINLYDPALWRYYTASSFNRLQSCYNKCMKIFFGYSRRYSVTQMLTELHLPSFGTVFANGCAVFTRTWFACPNTIVQYLRSI